MSLNIFKSVLAENGLRYTAARRAVFEALLFNKPPLSMRQLIEAVDNRFDRASVYRAVDTFIQTGIAHRIPIGFTYKLELSELFRSHHHHLSCVKCGQTQPFEDSNTELRLEQIAEHYGFSVHTHQIEVQGLCRSCRSKL